MLRRIGFFLLIAASLAVAACTPAPRALPIAKAQEVSALAESIRSLGPEVARTDAERVAQIAFAYSRQLAFDYQVTDPPLVHNAKVNMGLRPRGLCYHWADDLEARLRQEDLGSLTLHRAIANADKRFRIEHSTVIVSRKGDAMIEGIVLDPWRYGGGLYWSPTLKDERYDWVPRAEVFEMKRRQARRGWAA